MLDWLKAINQGAPLSRAFDMASHGPRASSWNTPNTGPNAELDFSGLDLRSRAHDLVRNNPHATKAVTQLTASIIGDGIQPQPQTGKDKTDELVKSLWEEFSEFVDLNHEKTFEAMQALAVRSYLESGDAFAVEYILQPGSQPIPLQYNIFEGDQLDASHMNLNYDHDIIQGIAYDANGRKLGYYLYKKHPEDGGSNFLNSIQESVFVPKSRVCHLYNEDRPGQVRGITCLAPVALALYDGKKYNGIEIQRKQSESSLMGVALKGNGGMRNLSDVLPTKTDSQSRKTTNLRPGSIIELSGVDDLKTITPSPSGGYAEFNTTNAQIISAGLFLPYELLTQDLSRVNYSSYRAGMIEYRGFIRQRRNLLVIPLFLKPIWRRFLQVAKLSGKLPQNLTVKVTWSQPHFPSIDPLKDAMANVLNVRNGFETHAAVLANQGRDPKKVLQEIKQFNDVVRELRLVFDSHPEQADKSGKAYVATEEKLIDLAMDYIKEGAQ